MLGRVLVLVPVLVRALRLGLTRMRDSECCWGAGALFLRTSGSSGVLIEGAAWPFCALTLGFSMRGGSTVTPEDKGEGVWLEYPVSVSVA